MYDRYIKVEGNAYERGIEIGTRLKEQIKTNYINQQRFYKETSSYEFENWKNICDKYIEYIEKYSSQVIEELKGMADGADMSLNEILSLTTAYEKSFNCEKISDKCTSFSIKGDVTKDNMTICGQTNDERFDEWIHELDVVIHHKDKDTGHEVMTYTHPGIPAYMGINNSGLAVLWTYIDNGKKQDGLPTNVIIRELLNKKSLKEAIEFLEVIPHAIPNQFTISHATDGIASVECFPNKVYIDNSKDIITHANHNCIAIDEEEKTRSWSTYTRLQAMNELINENKGNIDIEMAKDFLKSHRYFPKSICVHPNTNKVTSKTLASMIYDLSHGEMYIAYGNACELPYKKYVFDKYCI